MYFDDEPLPEEMEERRLPQSLFLPLLSTFLLWLAAPGDVGLWPFALVGMVPLLFFLETAARRPLSVKKALGAGLLFGTVLFLALLYWIVPVLSHFGGLPLPVAGLALLLLALYMSLYTAALFAGVRFAMQYLPPMALLLFIPALQSGLEWLRGCAFTGFPWMDLGNYLAMEPQLIQPAALFGHLGVTAMLVFINTAIWLLLSKRLLLRQRGQALVALVAGVGLYVLAGLLPVGNSSGDLRVAIIQGNVAQDVKWESESQRQTLVNYLTLSKGQLRGKEPQLFVWPETAVPFFPSSNPLGEMLGRFVEITEIPLLAGAPWFEIVSSQSSGEQPQKIKYYNAAMLLTPHEGLNLNFKSHLVPFGEYVPLQGLFPFLAPLVESAGNFTAGTVENPLKLTAAEGQTAPRLGTLICYESVFPELSRHWVDAGANLLINITNDAWYGRTSAPKHSLAMTVMRAVETRRAIVRSANTGYSGLILPDGRILGRTELFVPAAETLEVPLMEGRSLFVRGGWLFGPLALLCALSGLVFAAIRRRRLEESTFF